MFAYGQLSDLKDGRLVIPIKRVEDKIECSSEDGAEKFLLEFDDFDFDKTVSERNEDNIIIDDSSYDSSEEKEKLVIENITSKVIFKLNKANITYNRKKDEEKLFWIEEENGKIKVIEKIKIKR